MAIKDITERRLAEQEKQQLLEHTEGLLDQQRTLLREMRHRIANSLLIIASILLLNAGAVTSEETKNELRAAHQRVRQPTKLVISNGGTPVLVLTNGQRTCAAPSDLSCWSEAADALHDALDRAFPSPRQR